MKKLMGFIFLGMLVMAMPVKGQRIGLALPDTAGIAGNLIDVPVYVRDNLTGQGVTAYQLQINFTASRLSLQDVISIGTLTEALGSFNYNSPTSGQVVISAAGANALTGKGRLIIMRFRMLLSGTASLSFTDTLNNMLNEGSPSVNLANGRVVISNAPVITVSPNNALLAIGETINFNVSGGNAPFLWQVASPPVGNIDSIAIRTARFTALNAGKTRIIATDKDGITDSTDNYVEVRPFTMSLPDMSIFQGSKIVIPIYTGNISGLNIKSGRIVITHSATILHVNRIITEGSILSAYSDVTALIEPGKVTLAFAGATSLSGSGVLCYLEMESNFNYSGLSTLAINEHIFNEDILAKTYNGSCRVNGLPALAISPNTATTFTGETLQFTVGGAGGTGPLNWSTTDTLVATIDDSGLLSAIKSGAINVLVNDSLGARGTSGAIQIYDTRISIPDTSEIVSSFINVPVYVDAIRSNDPVFSVQGVFVYDAAILEIKDVITVGTIGEGWSHAVRIEGNRIIFALAGSAGTLAAGKIAILRFLVRASARIGARGVITIEEIMLNEGIPRAVLKSGSVTVLLPDSPLAPSLISPANGASFEPWISEFRWSRSVGAQSYHMQIADNINFTAPVFNDSTITDTTYLFAGLMDNSGYFWRIRAKNVSGTSGWTPAWQFQTLVNGIESINTGSLPDNYGLGQNYPNPFNPETAFEFSLPVAGNVRVEVYNAIGERAAVLVNGTMSAGTYVVRWSAVNQASGIYYYRFSAGEFVRIKRMILIK